MNELLRFEPTPDALRNGRRTMAITAVIGLVLGALNVAAGFTDPQTVAIFAALGLSLVGDAIAYLGQPTTTRYRLGLAITTVAIVAGFYFLLANPYAQAG